MTPKPFVQAACICEKVLREHDNVPSLIRLVDTYAIEPLPPLPPDLKAGLSLTLFVSLKSGDVVGEHEVRIRLVKPDGAPTEVGNQSLRFGGGESGVNVQVAFELMSPTFGLYWFEVVWGNDVLTRIPLRVKPKTSTDSSTDSTEREPSQPQTVS